MKKTGRKQSIVVVVELRTLKRFENNIIKIVQVTKNEHEWVTYCEEKKIRKIYKVIFSEGKKNP